jgi:hypothetical protein
MAPKWQKNLYFMKKCFSNFLMYEASKTGIAF